MSRHAFYGNFCYDIQASALVDISNNKVDWKEVAPIPMGRSAHAVVLLHGSVYVGGGYEGKNNSERKDSFSLDIYNLTTNRWDPFPITIPHCWFAMTVLDDKLIIAGGVTKRGDPTNKILVLDEGEWKDYSKMPSARAGAVAVGYQSMLIVVGGEGKVKGTWTSLATTELPLDHGTPVMTSLSHISKSNASF